MRLGGPGTLKHGVLERMEGVQKQKSMKVLENQRAISEEAHANRFYSSVHTAKLKLDLKAAGMTIPMPDDEVTALSQRFNDKLDEVDKVNDARKRGGWIVLFKELDNDASGLITYDEIRQLAQMKLKIKAKEVSDRRCSRCGAGWTRTAPSINR